MLTTALLTLALAPQGPNAPIVINEFSYDDSGTDDREYVELYNASTAAIDISGWTLDCEDIPLLSGSPNPDYTVDGAPMSGTVVLNPGDFWVMGSAMVTNVDQVIGTTNLFENSTESITLRDPNGRIIDTLIYESWVAIEPTLIEGDGVVATFANINGQLLSWSRVADGFDSGNNRDFTLLPETPGASNQTGLGTLPYFDDFDAGAAGTQLADWRGGFVDLTVIDPTLVGPPDGGGRDYNPNAIPASPQGGNASIMWDPSGGGNSNVLLRSGRPQACFSAWIYFDSSPEAVGEHETWSVGIGTSCGTFYNSPDPSGALGFSPNANGNRGVSWTCQALDSGVTLYLIDHNDGGWAPIATTPETVAQTIRIVPGVNDGWRRVELAVDLNTGRYRASFDGNGFMGSTAPNAGQPAMVYTGYREFVGSNALTRPLTMDDVLVCDTAASTATSGSGTAHNFGTPTIGANSAPTLGNAGFGITASGLVPNNPLSFCGIGVASAPTPIAGGIPGATLQISIIVAAQNASNAMGRTLHPVPIPGDCSLCGAGVSFQLLDADLSFPVLLPFGVSGRLDATLGL